MERAAKFLTPGQRAGQSVPIVAVRCEACLDTGIVSIGKRTVNDRVLGFGLAHMWCACQAGDKWKANPPKCINCGEAAEFMLTSKRPRCAACDLDFTAEEFRRRIAQ